MPDLSARHAAGAVVMAQAKVTYFAPLAVLAALILFEDKASSDPLSSRSEQYPQDASATAKGDADEDALANGISSTLATASGASSVSGPLPTANGGRTLTWAWKSASDVFSLRASECIKKINAVAPNLSRVACHDGVEGVVVRFDFVRVTIGQSRALQLTTDVSYDVRRIAMVGGLPVRSLERRQSVGALDVRFPHLTQLVNGLRDAVVASIYATSLARLSLKGSLILADVESRIRRLDASKVTMPKVFADTDVAALESTLRQYGVEAGRASRELVAFTGEPDMTQPKARPIADADSAKLAKRRDEIRVGAQISIAQLYAALAGADRTLVSLETTISGKLSAVDGGLDVHGD
jgi:hypothetical protein